MDDNNNQETVITHDIDMQLLKKELMERFSSYQKTIQYMTADAPISLLGLGSRLDKKLVDQGFLRIYDLIDLDLIKIEGLTHVEARNLTACLNKFFSML